MTYEAHKLNWDIKPYQADMVYDIYRKINDGSYVKIAEDVAVRTYTDNDISERGLYTYKIQAKLDGDVVAESIEYKFTIAFKLPDDEDSFGTNQTPDFVDGYDPDENGHYRAELHALGDYFLIEGLSTIGLSNILLTCEMRRSLLPPLGEGARYFKAYYYDVDGENIAVAFTGDNYDIVLPDTHTDNITPWVSISLPLPSGAMGLSTLNIELRVVEEEPVVSAGFEYMTRNEIKDVLVCSEINEPDLLEGTVSYPDYWAITGDQSNIYIGIGYAYPAGSEKCFVEMINQNTYKRQRVQIASGVNSPNELIIKGEYIYFSTYTNPVYIGRIKKPSIIYPDPDIQLHATNSILSHAICEGEGKIFIGCRNTGIIRINDINDISDYDEWLMLGAYEVRGIDSCCYSKFDNRAYFADGYTNNKYLRIFSLAPTGDLFLAYNDDTATIIQPLISGTTIVGDKLYMIGETNPSWLYIFDLSDKNIDNTLKEPVKIELEGFSFAHSLIAGKDGKHIYSAGGRSGANLVVLMRFDTENLTYDLADGETGISSTTDDIWDDSINIWCPQENYTRGRVVIFNKYDLETRTYYRYFEPQE